MCKKNKYQADLLRYWDPATIDSITKSAAKNNNYLFEKQLKDTSSNTNTVAGAEYALYSNLKGSSLKIYRPKGTSNCI